MIVPPLPDEVRGHVYAWESGTNVSYDRDLESGWKHLAVVRDAQRLSLYVDGQRMAQAEFSQPAYDLSNTEPLLIGFGQLDYFSGKIRDVRIYTKALDESEVRSIVLAEGIR